jgi:spermidine synthase
MAGRETTPNSSKGMFLLILACFFLSGLCGLIYEILWIRLIVQVIGGAPFSVSIILTVFMGGLGLGSYLAGRFIDRIKSSHRLVMLYGLLELLIGMYALLIPALLNASLPLQTVLYNRFYAHFIIYNFLTFLICAAVLCFPVACMGATLPILCRFYVTRLNHLGTHAGRLYGLNTIGAAAGSMLCGFWLINNWGVQTTLWSAVAVNLIIGVGCLIAGYKAGKDASETTLQASGRVRETARIGVPGEPLPHPFQKHAALVIFLVSGFCAMAAQVIWTRLLGLIVGPTTYSFTIVLVTFITGLALGGMIFGFLADRVKDCLWLLLCTQIAAALLVLAASQLLGNSQMLFAKLIYVFKDSFERLTVIKGVLVFAIMLPPTLCFGATFPLVGKIYTRSVTQVGRSIGFAYMVNTIGCLCGSFLAGFMLIPLFGKETGLTLIVTLQLLTALVAAAGMFRTPKQFIRQFGWPALAAAAGIALCGSYPAWSHHQLSIGKYQEFENIRADLLTTGWVDSFLNGPEILGKKEMGELVYYGEGIGGFTSVVKFPDALGNLNYAMANSGKTDASSRKDMETQTLLAHIPMLILKDPKAVMVIGLASGITAGEVLNYPVDKLDILEINDQVVEASNIFIPWNNRVLADTRSNLIVQDARAHLQLTAQSYDVIISEPSNPWMSGLAALFTRDFFDLVKNRLNPEGVFGQWIHAYQMDWDTFALVGRSFADVFPNSLLVNMVPHKHGGDYLLLGFKGNQKRGFEHARHKLAFIRKSKNLTLEDPQLLYRRVVSEDLKTLFGAGEINTDSRPRLEFAAPKLMYHGAGSIDERIQAKKWKTISKDTLDTIEQVEGNVDRQIDDASFSLSVYSPFPGMVDLAKANTEQKERFFELFDRYCADNELDYSIFADDALRQRCASIQVDVLLDKIDRLPDRSASILYLGNLYALLGRLPEAIHYFQKRLQAEPRSPAAHTNLGVAYAKLGRLEDAIGQFALALQIDPEDPQAYYNLGIALKKQDRLEEAARNLSYALLFRPDFADAHYQMGLVRANQGNLPDAIRHFSEAVTLNPKSMRTHNDLGIALARQGRLDGAIQHFSEAAAIAPEDAEVRNNLGLAMLQNGRFEDALIQFKIALRINPNFADARRNLQKANLQLGN